MTSFEERFPVLTETESIVMGVVIVLHWSFPHDEEKWRTKLREGEMTGG